MAIDIHTSLGSYAEYVRANDPHAEHRLRLLQEVEGLQSETPARADRDRTALAAKLERWRYQLLNERAGDLRPEDRGLSDALDLAANDLAARPPRPPRAVRASVADSRTDDDAISQAIACLELHVALEDLADHAVRLTREHFGRDDQGQATSLYWRMLLYAPIYLSNYCVNYCTYCGFRYPNPIERRHLDRNEALQQAELLLGRGFRHLLLVGGDFPGRTTPRYYADVARSLARGGVEVGIEVAPQSTDSYAALADAGVCGVTLYQETYDEDLYARYHPRGSKALYDWRIEGLERAAEAGMRRLGLGILLGLADPRKDLLSMLRHGRYLRKRFPDRALAFSLPRIHEAPEGFVVPHPVEDEMFVRMYCALRIAFPDAFLVLSTREPARLRNRLARTCITQLSAGSSTAPGGYESAAARAGEQFPVCDGRSAADVADWLRQTGFDVVWRFNLGF